MFTILAIPSIGFAIAVPLFQCALLVSGIWGIFLFKVRAYTAVYSYLFLYLYALTGN